MFAVTEDDRYLFARICGFSGINAAFAIALKQRWADRLVINYSAFAFFKIKVNCNAAAPTAPAPAASTHPHHQPSSHYQRWTLNPSNLLFALLLCCVCGTCA